MQCLFVAALALALAAAVAENHQSVTCKYRGRSKTSFISLLQVAAGYSTTTETNIQAMKVGKMKNGLVNSKHEFLCMYRPVTHRYYKLLVVF
jgi:hypothetical protein